MEKQHQYSGKMLGDYQLMDELASSASGKLFLASSSSFLEHKVVVKLLLATPIHTQQEQEQFLQEARFFQQLRHPHILPILDVGIDETIPYLVTAYAPHGSLHSRLHRSSTSSLARAEILTIISQIGQALLYAHRHNVIHGDLKPQNILFNSEGHALLADFAFPALKTTRRDASETLPYVAPEQLAGSGNRKSDQYALGCIIYEMFTGKAPFAPIEAGSSSEPRPRPMLAQLKAQLPQDLSSIILKAIAREPRQRYSDMQDFLQALGVLTMPSSSPALYTNEAVTQTPAPQLSSRNHISRTSRTLRGQHRTGGSKFHKIRQPQSIKEWPLIAIAVVIIILSILGTLTFGGLSISASQANPGQPGISTTHALTPTQSTLLTPTVVVTPTATQPPVGQRVKSNPTPTPTPMPTLTPTPTTEPPISSALVSLSPGSFSPINCTSVSDHFACTATLSLSSRARNVIGWYTTSENTDITFRPDAGFLFPGQAVKITIDIPRNCPGSSSFSFVTSRTTLTASWNC